MKRNFIEHKTSNLLVLAVILVCGLCGCSKAAKKATANNNPSVISDCTLDDSCPSDAVSPVLSLKSDNSPNAGLGCDGKNGQPPYGACLYALGSNISSGCAVRLSDPGSNTQLTSPSPVNCSATGVTFVIPADVRKAYVNKPIQVQVLNNDGMPSNVISVSLVGALVPVKPTLTEVVGFNSNIDAYPNYVSISGTKISGACSVDLYVPSWLSTQVPGITSDDVAKDLAFLADVTLVPVRFPNNAAQVAHISTNINCAAGANGTALNFQFPKAIRCNKNKLSKPFVNVHVNNFDGDYSEPITIDLTKADPSGC